MKRVLILSMLLWVFLLPPVYAGKKSSWTGKVVGVFDGDTLTIQRNGGPEIIRLQGIDCPEISQDGGALADEFTRKMVEGKTVEVSPFFTDDYGRTVADVWIGGRSLGEELVKAGLAEKSTDFPPEEKSAVTDRLSRLKKMALGLFLMGLVQESENP